MQVCMMHSNKRGLFVSKTSAGGAPLKKYVIKHQRSYSDGDSILFAKNSEPNSSSSYSWEDAGERLAIRRSNRTVSLVSSGEDCGGKERSRDGHKCVWQQQVKDLTQKLRSFRKQVRLN